ncbi:MAG: glycosyltransferase [Mediterranea sp.]|jgi:glycosyltransferase involved in cell wall biosynthesis|nr:glycosyltransferase [Mediterranea sp.]
MKVLHTGTLNVNAGGPAMSTYNTLCGLQHLGVEVEVLMYPLAKKLIGDRIPTHFTSKPLDSKLLYFPKSKKLIKALGDYDIYHAQGVWFYITYALIDAAKQKAKPYLVTPRGMLYPRDMDKSNGFLKKLSLKIRLLNDLNKAACVHVTCEEEMQHCRNLGVTSPIAIIPNPVEIKEYAAYKRDSIFRLGYIGRLSPRKNVESLIYAWNTLRDKLPESELLIIGGGDEHYESFLRDEAKRLGLPNVRFVGFLSGREKDEALASVSVLAMPSEFENLGNVVLEGLVRRIPCIATKGSPWESLNTHRCGWWVEYKQDAITNAIMDAALCSTDELKAMGERGRTLMEQCYSIDVIANKMKHLYEWVLDRNEKPEFVYI